MPTFDITSEVDWPEVSNAADQASREVRTRFDFKGVESDIVLDQKGSQVTLKCSEEGKLDAVKDILQTKLVKRGISLLALKYDDPVPSSGRSARQLIHVRSGLSKEDAKKVQEILKEEKLKVKAKLQDQMIRVTGSKRDVLQTAIATLKEKEQEMRIPLQFGNFRD
jgi:cyclic-di-GMP-binding protein